MILRGRNPFRDLEKRLGYRFRRKFLLEEALTHPSYRAESTRNADNQRLEFLGDAVLGFVAAAYLFHRFEEEPEGVLTSLRSQVTSGRALATTARDMELGVFLRMGRGEDQTGGRRRRSNLADALEAVLGAALLDGGVSAVERIFKKVFVPFVDQLSGNVWASNPKGELQEYSQRHWKKSPAYAVVSKEGPAHDTVFTVRVELEDGAAGTGAGRNKQESETRAAQDALRQLRRKGKI